MSSEVPEPWASAMIAAGLIDSRYTDPRPSMRQLADKAGTSTSTVSAMIDGSRDTSGDVIQRVAEALGLTERANEVARWAGLDRTEAMPFEPHRDTNLLTAEEREAVNELIRLLALPKKQGSVAHGNAAAIKVPEPGPANQPGEDSSPVKTRRGGRQARLPQRSATARSHGARQTEE